nr:protein LEO1 homolog isoform X2 [Tanacetum cinerariifolium]
MKPKGGDVVEGHGEAEVGSDSDGELQEVDQENLESEGKRDQSSQEVDSGDQRDERDKSKGKDSGSDQIGQRVVTKEKDEAYISDTAPKIRDVFGELDDEEPVDYDVAQTNVKDDTN